MGGTHTWMWAKKEDKLIEEDTVVLPIAVGLTVVLLVVTILYFLHKRPSVAGRTGTHTTLEGGKFVRRSSRSKKEVSRWSPDDLGTPTGMKDEREKSVLGSLTPTNLGKKVREIKQELPSPASLSPLPASAKKPSRQPKSAAKASPPSPPRTRRQAAATPKR